MKNSVSHGLQKRTTWCCWTISRLLVFKMLNMWINDSFWLVKWLTFGFFEMCKDCWRVISVLVFVRIEICGHSWVWVVFDRPDIFPVCWVFTFTTEPNHSVLLFAGHTCIIDDILYILRHIFWQLCGIVRLRLPAINLQKETKEMKCFVCDTYSGNSGLSKAKKVHLLFCYRDILALQPNFSFLATSILGLGPDMNY